MHVLRARPGYDWEDIEIAGTIASMQDEVGGCFRLMRFTSDAAVLYNPAAEGVGMRYNRRFLGTTFFGTFLIVGVDDGEPTDVTMTPRLREWVG